MKTKISEIDRIWRNEYPDLPMMRQAIDIHCRISTHPASFRLIANGAAPALSIRPFSASGQYLQDSSYHLSLEEENGAIRVDIEEDAAHYVTGLTIQNMQSPSSSTQFVCMHNDRNAPEDWIVCHNSIDRKKQLLKSIKSKLTRTPDDILLIHFINSLLDDEHSAALKLVEENASLQKIKNTLNVFTAKFERELNAHGIKKTFRYWSTDEKTAYLQSASDLTLLLVEKFPNTALGFGSVLGFQRHADLIAHDDDIDVLVAFLQAEVPNLPHALDMVTAHLNQHGYKVEGVFFSHLWVRTPQGYRMDVFVGLIESDNSLSFYPSARRSLSLQDVFPTTTVDLLTVKLPFPANLCHYLAKTYGKDWQSPDAHFSHPWDRESYKDLDAPRKRPAILTRGELMRMRANPTRKNQR